MSLPISSWRLRSQATNVARSIVYPTSFLGFFDLKLGVTLITFWSLLNKVSGAYGILAVFVGGTPAQLSMYIYSIVTIIFFLWAFKKIKEESPETLAYANLFAIDHIVNTVYLIYFGNLWWFQTPHDGERKANSDAQKQMMSHEETVFLSADARRAAALAIWAEESSIAFTVLILGWLVKVYFILVVYSYARHVRRGVYHTLPATRGWAAS